MRRLWMTAAGFLVLAGCRTEGTQDQALGTEREGTGEVAMDREHLAVIRILSTLHAINQAEVDMGKLAQQKASSQQVKDFAAKLVEEHQHNIDALNLLAKNKNLDLDMAGIGDDPLLTARKDAAAEELKKLRGLSGQAFDAAFMTAQPGTHAFFIELADEGQKLAKDADIKGFFISMVGQGRDHTDKALAVIPQSCGGHEAAGWTSPGAPAPGQPAQKGQQRQPSQKGMQPGQSPGQR